MAEINSRLWSWLNGVCTKHHGQTLPCQVCIDSLDDDLVRPSVVEGIVQAIDEGGRRDYIHPAPITPAEAKAVASCYGETMHPPENSQSFAFIASRSVEIPVIFEAGAWDALMKKPGVALVDYSEIRPKGGRLSTNIPVEIPLANLIIDERLSFKVPDAEYEAALAASIEDNGLLSPITVEPDKGGKYHLLNGFRRVEAVKLLKWTKIPAYVTHSPIPTVTVDLVSQKTESEEIRKAILKAEQWLIDSTNADIAAVYNQLRAVYVKTRKPTKQETAEHQARMNRAELQPGIEPIPDWKIKPVQRNPLGAADAGQPDGHADPFLANAIAEMESFRASRNIFNDPGLGKDMTRISKSELTILEQLPEADRKIHLRNEPIGTAPLCGVRPPHVVLTRPISDATCLEAPWCAECVRIAGIEKPDASAHMHIRLADGAILGGCNVSSPSLAVHVREWTPTPPSAYAWCPICLEALARAGR